MVYGRYNELVNGVHIMFINQQPQLVIIGGAHPVPNRGNIFMRFITIIDGWETQFVAPNGSPEPIGHIFREYGYPKFAPFIPF